MFMNYYCLFQDSVYSMGFPISYGAHITVGQNKRLEIAKILLNNIEKMSYSLG